MDESGGSGQPRSGNDGATDRETRPTDTEGPERNRDHATTRPTPGTEPTGRDAATSREKEEDSASTPAAPGPRDDPTGPGPSAAGSGDEPPTSAGPTAPSGDEPATPATPTTPATAEPAPSPHADVHLPSSAAGRDAEPVSDGRPVPPPAQAAHSDGRTAPDPHGDSRDAPPTGNHPGVRDEQTPPLPPGPHDPADTPPAGDRRPHDPADGPHAGNPAARAHAHSGGPGKGRPPQRPKEPGGGILMGRPFGVPVYVAPSWFLVAALITWVFGGQLDRVLPELGAARYLVSLFFAVAFYASVLVHELAHTVAALRFKLPVRRIQLQFFGGVSEIEKEAETPGREFVLAFVGPLLSLLLAGLFYLAMQPVRPGTVPGVLLAGLMISNLIVAAFNLLPGLPLDGGRMLRAVVWKITGRPMSGTIAAAWVGRALAVTVLFGLPVLTQSGALGPTVEDNVGMDTVTDALLAAILAAIIWTGAGNSLRMARLRQHLPELRARTLTRRAVPVETHTPLSEALRRANEVGARALVVVDAHGAPLSLVREAAIVGVPEHSRPWVTVSGLAQELTDGMRVSAELAGEDLLDVLRATPATEYLVVEDTGEIYGVLSAADVERAFVKAMARPS